MMEFHNKPIDINFLSALRCTKTPHSHAFDARLPTEDEIKMDKKVMKYLEHHKQLFDSWKGLRPLITSSINHSLPSPQVLCEIYL